MKEIYVLDEHGNLQLIDAGVDSYHELTDAPIKTTYNGVTLVGSSVENGVVIPATDPADIHKWSAAELLSFCESAQSGRYDIITEEMGTEILMIDNTDADLGRRYRRITADQDLVYDINAGWISISDSSARALVFRINNLSAIPSTLVVGNRLVLECYYYSTVGNGNITIMKGERTVAAASLEVGKTTTITLTSEVTDGINEFRYLVTNNGFGSLERQQTGTIGITGIQLLYNPRFNELQIQRGDVNFPVSYSGTGTKFANFKITKPDGSSTEFSDRSIPLVNDGGTTFTLSADHFAHGANIIETYMYMMDGNSDAILTRTDPVTYNFPYVVDNAKPIVMTYFDYSTLQEWDTVSVPYRIWASENMSSIKFEIQYTQEDGVAQFVQQTYDGSKEANVNNYLTKDVEHKWQISNLPHGELIFRIYLNGEVEPYYESEVVNVAKSSYDFKTVGGYLFNFAANDVVSTEAFSEWDSNGYTMKLENFNFFTDGIVTEVDKGLKFSSASRATLDVDKSLFDYAAGSEGTTIEFDFKVDDNADNTKPIIRYGAWDEPTASWSNRFGIIVYPTKAVLNYDTKSAAEEALLVNFQKGERINLGFVIEPQSASDTHHYIKIFINGILSKVIRYISGDSTKFPDNTKHFAFNVSGNEFYLYGFRAYKTLLSSSQMLQNYISNFASVDTKVSMLGANNIFSNNTITLKNGDSLTGEYYASFSKVKGKIGCLVMIMDKLPETKDYLPCHTIYYEKDENNPEVETHSSGRSMATTYYFKDGVLNKEIKVGAQGTSSLEYPRKNFKFKYKDKFYIKGHKKGKDKTFTMKADYMDSSGANNITNAQIMDNAIIRSEWTNTPAQAGARLNLDGFPICIFHAKYVDNDGIPYNLDENGQRLEPEYLGIFNFNYDKKAKDLLGWNKYTDAAGVNHTYDFQGFEFRDNTSDICLQKGISGMLGFVNANTGYEWRWTTLSDLVDDFHDKHLGATIDGGYFDEDHNQYTEEQYIKNRVSKEAIALKPFNRFHITREGKRYQVMLKQEDGTYKPFNYLDFNRGTSVFNLEFGVKIAENAIYWQLPYGARFDTTSNKIIDGTRYPSGEGYYKYSRNPEHMAKFEYNDAEPYFTDLSNWEKLCDLDGVVYGMHESYTEAADGDYILDPADDLYHPLSYYVMYNAAGEVDPAGTFIEIGEDEYEDISEAPRYTKTVEYIQVTNDDIIETEDLMREIYGHWYYCVDTLAHCTDKNYLPLIDSNRTYSDELGNNGNGLFIYDALLQYYCASVITALCDNFAKNMFIHSYDGGLTWSPAWYDMD